MFTTDLTKMKKQRLMRVTLWQKNSLQMAKKVTTSTFPTTAPTCTRNKRHIKNRKEKDPTI